MVTAYMRVVSGIGGAYATSRQGSIADGLRSTWWKWDTAALSASLLSEAPILS